MTDQDKKRLEEIREKREKFPLMKDMSAMEQTLIHHYCFDTDFLLGLLDEERGISKKILVRLTAQISSVYGRVSRDATRDMFTTLGQIQDIFNEELQ